MVRDYQENYISELIANAYLNVPYYKSLMDDHGLKPEDVNTREALSEFPMLLKEDVSR